MACANGSCSPDLQRQHRRRSAEMIEHLGRMHHRAPDQHWRQRLVDQAGAVLGADGGKIAPHLAPAMFAVLVLCPHEHGRAIVHPAERGHDRRCERVAVAERLQRADIEGRGHGVSSPRFLSTSRPGERRHPYRVIYRECKVVDAVRKTEACGYGPRDAPGRRRVCSKERKTPEQVSPPRRRASFSRSSYAASKPATAFASRYSSRP